MPAQTKAQRVERIQGGLNIKTDCFGYDPSTKECTAMKELICMNKKCSFYKPREAAAGSSQEEHTNYLLEELKEREEYCEKCPYKHETGHCEHCATRIDILELEAQIYSSQEERNE